MFSDIFTFFSSGDLWGFLTTQLATNQFSQGAIVAGLVMGVITWGKSIPSRLWGMITKLCTIDMRFNSDSPDYEAISRFVTQTIVKDVFSRNFVFQTECAYDDSTHEVSKHRGLTAGYGTHIGLY